jgi:hypothetical protein
MTKIHTLQGQSKFKTKFTPIKTLETHFGLINVPSELGCFINGCILPAKRTNKNAFIHQIDKSVHKKVS